MNRLEKMKDYLREVKEKKVLNRINKICSLCVGEKRDEILAAVRGLVLERMNGNLVICYLRSSYIINSHEFLILFYSQEPFVEEEPDCLYYDMHILLQEVEDDIQVMYKMMEEKFIRVLSYEKEEIRRWYMEQIYIEFEQFFSKLLNGMRINMNIQVYYGEYMGEIHSIENNKQKFFTNL